MVELMVGIAISLVIVAAALSVLALHLRENRSLLLAARLMQDLRSSSELIARDLRRAGHWHQASAGVWRATAPGTQANPHTEFAASDGVSFAYSRDADSNPRLAYRLRAGVIDMQIGDGHWQAMTDGNTLQVTSFRITPQVQHIVLDGFCSRPCAEGSSTCPPRQALRSLMLRIEARAATDPTVTRSVQTTVRLRNDALSGACPA